MAGIDTSMMTKPDPIYTDKRQRELEEYIRRKEHEMRMAQAPPFLGNMEQLHQMDRVAGPWGHGQATMLEATAHFDSMLKTADAFKDVLGWLRAQSVFIQETYKDDQYRRALHMQVLNEGFRSLLKQKDPQ